MHFYRASFSQDKIRRIVSDMEHKSWKRKNNTGVPEEVIHHPGAGVEVPLLHFPLLEKTGIVKEGFTTRLGGVSEGIFSTMNLSFTRGDEEEAVRENYRRLASALDVDYDKFVFTDQTHTTNVRKVTAEGIRKQTGGTALCDRTVHLSGLLRGERGCCGGV